MRKTSVELNFEQPEDLVVEVLGQHLVAFSF